MVCFGQITSSNHLSMARGHCLTTTLGSPLTTKMALIVAARTIFIWPTSRANINMSSSCMQAGRSIRFLASSIIPQLMVQKNAAVSLAEGSISFHFNISMNFLCLMTRSGLLAKNFCESFDGLPEGLPAWCWRCQAKYYCRGKVIQLVCYETKCSSSICVDSWVLETRLNVC
jgi:hypothetical protein